MDTNSQTVVTLEEATIVLTADDVSIEKVASAARPTGSTDRLEDDSLQANAQNFQNN